MVTPEKPLERERRESTKNESAPHGDTVVPTVYRAYFVANRSRKTFFRTLFVAVVTGRASTNST